MATLHERFWSRVDASGECWTWSGVRDGDGYGRLKIGGRMVRAHRHAAGVTDPRVHVCHRCDNRACVRASHLFLGSNADNMRDKVSKGRADQKLTSADAAEIRSMVARGVSISEAARRFGVSRPYASQLVHGRKRAAVSP